MFVVKVLLHLRGVFVCVYAAFGDANEFIVLSDLRLIDLLLF